MLNVSNNTKSINECYSKFCKYIDVKIEKNELNLY